MSKVIELFYMADDLASLIFNFVSFFDTMMSKYHAKPVMKHTYRRTSTI